MSVVRVFKHLPWLILTLILAAGSVLWLLFVGEQKDHLEAGFRNQLERMGDDLFRGHLEGRLAGFSLPDGVRTFAVYGPGGNLVAGWGDQVPPTVPTGSTRGPRTLNKAGDWLEFTKALVPPGPRMESWEDQPPGPPGPPPGQERRPGGYLFLRVASGPLESRLWAWSLGAAVGTAAWAGFIAFVGVLWFRTRKFRETLAQNRELIQFAEASRTLGHELQNPLAAILLQTALLTRAAGGTPVPEVRIIEEEARRMSALTARVRDFLKDPAGTAETVDLGTLVQSMADRFSTPVEIVLEGTPPFEVAFEPQRLRSVVENLVKNAVEAAPEPPPKVVLSRLKSGVVRMEILDFGPGFGPEGLKMALRPFYTTKVRGTGIGLSITDNFVRAAGGRLRLENRAEGGARVAVDFL